MKTSCSFFSVSIAVSFSVLGLPAGAWGATFTTDTQISSGDATYDGQDVVVDGCTVTIDGSHAFNSLQVIAGGVVTHSVYTGGDERLDLAIALDVSIDAASRIDVSGRGYARESGPGAGVMPRVPVVAAVMAVMAGAVRMALAGGVPMIRWLNPSSLEVVAAATATVPTRPVAVAAVRSISWSVERSR